MKTYAGITQEFLKMVMSPLYPTDILEPLSVNFLDIYQVQILQIEDNIAFSNNTYI
jgi:hypothetical protein